MDPLIALDATVGFFTRTEAHAAGYDDRDLARGVQAAQIRRIRQGSYAFATSWDPLDDVARHRIRSQAVVRSLGDAVCLSHVSACIQHGADIWNYPLDRVHVTRLDGGASRTEGDVVHHRGVCLDDDLVTVDGLLMTRADRSVIETASTGSPEAGLGLFNSLLHGQAFTIDDLMARHHAMRHWPGVRRLHVPLRLADPRAASMGESRGVWMFWEQHLPAPIPQFEVCDAQGNVVATCDWGWPDLGMLGEFDGRIKYGRLLKPGLTAGDVIFAEKQREQLVCDLTDCRMFRVIWDDFGRPRVAAQRFRRMMR